MSSVKQEMSQIATDAYLLIQLSAMTALVVMHCYKLETAHLVDKAAKHVGPHNCAIDAKMGTSWNPRIMHQRESVNHARPTTTASLVQTRTKNARAVSRASC